MIMKAVQAAEPTGERLNGMSNRDLMLRVQRVAEAASLRRSDSTRHKCFVSYHVADVDEVTKFLDDFGTEFIPRSVGVTEEDDFVDSADTEYIKRRIRERYLTDSTVTVVLVGRCTWSRKFVDWEISSSLRHDSLNKRSGLLVMPLTSMNNTARLSDRIRDNWFKADPKESYAAYKAYPSSASCLRLAIDEAFLARTGKADKVDNSRSLRLANATC
ncbi:TIR domain-containing protein [Humibacillus sp. DSM 29435]|uniref:TIR domain-containing protein n=1 Tax=Humibacillus sp. DSM 29435 TaxID=1869167 RepID=UPI0015864947|nr:TIR domain-containing protein [Humibacillus sp. DSM 29435]